jgi:hypothetical protein
VGQGDLLLVHYGRERDKKINVYFVLGYAVPITPSKTYNLSGSCS